MAKRKKIITVLLCIGVGSIAFIFTLFILPQFWPCYKCKGHCSSAESDANNIAAAIADYFSIPEHTQIRPGDLDDWFQTENPWTLVQCGEKIFIYVYDIKEDCPVDYQNNYPEWDSHLYTKILE